MLVFLWPLLATKRVKIKSSGGKMWIESTSRSRINFDDRAGAFIFQKR
jgi:hypothetical protein